MIIWQQQREVRANVIAQSIDQVDYAEIRLKLTVSIMFHCQTSLFRVLVVLRTLN